MAPKPTLLVFALLVCPLAVAQEPTLISLRWGFSKLDGQWLELQREIVTVSKRDGKELARTETTLRLRQDLRWYGRRGSVQESIKRVDSKVSNSSGESLWSSAKPAAGSQELRRQLEPELSRKTFFLTTNRGLILDMPEIKDEQRKRRAMDAQRALTLELPAESIPIGGSWKVTTRVATAPLGTLVNVTRYTLKSLDSNIAVITLRLSTELDPRESTLPKGSEVRIDAKSSKGTGTIRFDLGRGLLLERRMKTVLVVTTKDALGTRRSETRSSTIETLQSIGRRK